MAELEIAREDAGAALEALRRVAELPDFPLATEARSAFRKLAFDLDVDRFGETPVLFADRPGAGDVQRTLRLVSRALLARKRVRFVYRGIYRDRETRRDVAPYGLFFQGGHWYLVGHDATREDLRVFRAERMREVSPNPARPRTPDYEIPEDFRLEGYLRKQAWELGGEDEEPLEARVLFPFPRSVWAERNGHGRLLEEREDGSAVRSFQVRQVNPFLRWMLSLEGEAELLEPRELRRELGELAGAVVALYEDSSDG